MRPSPYDRAVAALEAAHREDPSGTPGAEETPTLAYHRHLLRWLLRLAPGASEALRLAAMAQHLRRWRIGRGDFPAGVAGYKRWRTTLAQFHAQQCAVILGAAGVDAATIARVGELLTKKGLKTDAEVQRFEDAVCLVFLETQLAAFALKHDDQKLLGILAKTWKKMTPQGHREATPLVALLPARVQTLLRAAIAATPAPREGPED